MTKEDILPQASRIKTPEDELMVLAELSETTYFLVVKRVVRRFIEKYKNDTFLLNKDDPKFESKFSDLTAEAKGMNLLIKTIEGSRIELAKRNGDRI